LLVKIDRKRKQQNNMNSSHTPRGGPQLNSTSNSNYNEDVFREEAIPFVIYNSELRSKSLSISLFLLKFLTIASASDFLP